MLIKMHYFTNNIDGKSDEFEFSEVILGEKFRFVSDIGVFSKGELDIGSRLLIESFDESEVSGDVLDVGCGYGPIGLSLARLLPDSVVHMVDVNLRALGLTKKGAELNGVSNVRVYESFCYDGVDGKFGAILSNPPIRAGKKIVHQIIEQSIDYLEDNGSFWVVIGKKQGAPSAQAKMMDVYGNCELVVRKKGFWILKSRK